MYKIQKKKWWSETCMQRKTHRKKVVVAMETRTS